MPSSIYDTAYANAIRVNKPIFPEDTVEEIIQLSTFPDNMVRIALETIAVCMCVFVCICMHVYLWMQNMLF